MPKGDMTAEEFRGAGLRIRSTSGLAALPQTRTTAQPVAQGRRAKEPNKTEADYARRYLEGRRLAGELLRYDFEGITLRLPGGVRYTPDWCAVNRFGRVELHEVKGAHVWDDSVVKLKVAASMFPFQFTLAKKVRGEWTVLRVSEGV